MGTDSLGAAFLCRVLTGLHTTVLAALAVVVLSVVIGSVLGSLSGVYRRRVRFRGDAHYRCLHGIPDLGFGIAIAGLLGGGLQNAVIALVVPGWTRFCAHCPFFRVGVERASLHSGGSYRRSGAERQLP